MNGSRGGRKMRILIGHDGTPPADRMLRDLERAALPESAEVTVVTLVEPWARFADPKSGAGGWPSAAAKEQYHRQLDLILQSARRKAEKTAVSLSRRFPGWKVSVQAELDAPAHGLLTRAEKAKVDLIVVGSHGRGLFGRALLGSVSDKVIKHAAVDVRVSRVGSAKLRTAPPRVIVAVDGSPAALRAAEAAARRPWPKGTAVRVVGVVDPRYLAGTFLGADMGVLAPLPGSEARTWLEKKLAEAADRFAGRVPCATGILVGDPRRALLKEAKAWKADCIFAGASGLTGVERLLLGSVSSALAAHAPCSVEIVRGPKKRRPG